MNKEYSIVNRLELASELANEQVVDKFFPRSPFEIEENDGIRYTEEAQDVFNEFYDKYEKIILSCEVE